MGADRATSGVVLVQVKKRRCGPYHALSEVLRGAASFFYRDGGGGGGAGGGGFFLACENCGIMFDNLFPTCAFFTFFFFTFKWRLARAK